MSAAVSANATNVFFVSGNPQQGPLTLQTVALDGEKPDDVAKGVTGYALSHDGQKLLVRNSDPVLHNVHATPKINKEFNLAQMAGGKDIERVFDQSEVFVRFKCDVHPWMFAYVGVLPHPYHAVTDKDGNFKIAGVPPGKYKLAAFHRKTHVTDDKAQVQEITVGDQPVKADFTVEAAAQ